MVWLMEFLKIHLKRTALDKVLCDKAFNIIKNPNFDVYQSGLALVVYKFFDKKSYYFYRNSNFFG